MFNCWLRICSRWTLKNWRWRWWKCNFRRWWECRCKDFFIFIMDGMKVTWVFCIKIDISACFNLQTWITLYKRMYTNWHHISHYLNFSDYRWRGCDLYICIHISSWTLSYSWFFNFMFVYLLLLLFISLAIYIFMFM